MDPGKVLLVNFELQKILDAKFIKDIAYLEWVSNLVIVPKSDGRIKIYIDFRDINKSYPRIVFHYPTLIS